MKELIAKINQYYKDDEFDILNAYKEEKYTTLRVNTIKSSVEEITEFLRSNNILYEKVKWSDFSFIIKSDFDLTNFSIYQEGKIYLQSLSSQLPPLFLNPKENEIILDMAASPGGKTTEIAALTNNQAMITAIEKNKIRAERLKYNVDLQGAKKVTILNVDARNIDQYFMFDKILLDAPCSGSGTINGNSGEFNLNYLDKLCRMQQCLLEEATKHLVVGGEIIYSTCSILKEENEEIVKSILKNNDSLEIVPLDLDNYKDIPLLPSNINGVITVKPTKYYEGFFVSKIRKVK